MNSDQRLFDRLRSHPTYPVPVLKETLSAHFFMIAH